MKRGNVFKLVGLAATLVLATLLTPGTSSAQPVFPPASGCKESAVLTFEQFLNPGRGAFTVDRTIIPGEDTQVVLGAWVVVDGFVSDPTAGTVSTPNCPAAPTDGNPTYVTNLVVKPVSGDPTAIGVTQLTFWLDNDLDGQITPGKDTQIGTVQAQACLTSPTGCVLTFGSQPILRGTGSAAGLASSPVPLSTLGSAFPPGICSNFTPPRGGPSCAGIIIVGDVQNPQPSATLQVRLEAYASDLVNTPVTPFSSDFAPQYQKTTSSVRVVVQGVPNAPGALSPSVNNGSGNSETGVLGVGIQGIRTRGDRGGLSGTLERDARPGDREYVVGLVALCEAGDLVTPNVTLLPPVAGATPTIAGGLGAIPCIPTTGATDLNGTSILRIRIGVSGPGAQYVQAIHVYADTAAALGATGWAATGVAGTAAAQLFETGELVGNAIPVNGVAVIGSLEQVLTTSGGMPLVLAAGPGNPPALLYFTADISDQAQAGEVVFQVAVDVGDVPLNVFTGVGGPSSNLIRTQPQAFTFQITGPAAPPVTGVAAYDTNGNGVIDDPEFFTAIGDWVNGTIDDVLFFQIVDAWVAQTPVMGLGLSSLGAKVTLAQSSQGLTLSAGGPNVAGLALRVYDLNGRTVFVQETVGTTLSWNYLSADGRPVANGVYLYVVTVKGEDGQILTSRVNKLVVVR